MTLLACLLLNCQGALTHPLHVLAERAVEGNLLFDMLSLPARQAIFRSMSLHMVSAGTTIINQGDTDATKFYVLEKGTCDVLINNEATGYIPKKVHTYPSGSGFGELALLYSAPRAATVLAVTDCKLWVMERAVYNSIKRTYQEQVAALKRKMVSSVPMLAVLSEESRDLVAGALEAVEFKAGQTIFRQGEKGDRFYIVQEGAVTVSKTSAGERTVLAKLAEGSYFGERALIKDDVRAADVTADIYTVCYSLGRKAFDELLGPIEDVWRFEALRKVPVLFALSEQQLFELAHCMKNHAISAGQMVFRQGDPGDVFYVIEEGTFTIFDNSGKELARVSKGSCFGELALMHQDLRAANVKALTDGVLLALHRDDFNGLLGSLTHIRHMWRFEALRKVPLFSTLTPPQRSQLCTVLKPLHVKAGTAIVQAGNTGNTFYVVEAGTCVVHNVASQEIGRLGPTMYFGELALLRNEPRAATVLALTDCDLLELGRADFLQLMGPLAKALESQAAKYGLAVSAKKDIKATDLVKIAVLGSGAFGQVMLVKHEGAYMALKSLSKQQILEMGLHEHVKREKQIMAECDCPFMVNLVTSFKDGSHLYMLMECVMGGELFTYLQSRSGPLKEDHARFYAASVVCGLEYMQEHNLMWRDLKPENLLIETTGYVKMADFGFAKKMPPGQKSNTLCGTPEYLAPELVTQAGHTRAVDWWALGVLIYEMVAGYPPFYDEDRVAMFKNICQVKYSVPSHFSKEVRDLIKRLLVHNPNQRMGALKAGAADVKAHPWFANFDWAAFSKRQLKAPYIPQSNKRYVSTGVFKDF
ncbi:putative cGMP-dependent protein kinase [Coccomyxa subellipsoidea C-169]|uniref:cGMP-dependent protein kinase n=1 Tax=Coccomyxa subellipsoidea (strain C-169) TaxID=574566 RepID=I0Z269_COCSC|nr:putative cGMP-dependent protein kinase [Coccomyxa subellipsoidea C-169]EIE24738.1 putative cGMP-dependent protein kinase [Coccomyxa subellipsoidea C-169]|eukprot:XP_005649282.1 putative cGMP-dependent protein kinase [Coccomyxa subellipsoidea C-169]